MTAPNPAMPPVHGQPNGPGPVNFTVQRLDPEGWNDLGVVSTWEQVEAVIATHHGYTDEQGVEHEPDWFGWIVARATALSVHTRKDGRWRVLERPANGV